MLKKYNLEQVASSIEKPWSPVDVVVINDYVLRMAQVKGKYHWHTHEDEDEFFLVLKGELLVETEKEDIKLTEGEGTLVSKGVRHRTSAKKLSTILMFEPESLVSAGDEE